MALFGNDWKEEEDNDTINIFSHWKDEDKIEYTSLFSKYKEEKIIEEVEEYGSIIKHFQD